MLGLLGELDGDQWAVQSLCPDWTVQGVVGHLGGVEAMMTGWRPEAEKPPPFAEVGTFVSEAAVLDPTALLARFTEVLDARSADMANVDDELLAAPSFTPVGVQTYGRFLAIRVFDFCVHEQDLRGTLGIACNESGPAAEMALDDLMGDPRQGSPNAPVKSMISCVSTSTCVIPPPAVRLKRCHRWRY